LTLGRRLTKTPPKIELWGGGFGFGDGKNEPVPLFLNIFFCLCNLGRRSIFGLLKVTCAQDMRSLQLLKSFGQHCPSIA